MVDSETLLSHKEVTQGDPLSMVLYGLSLSVMEKQIRTKFPEFIQSWYTYDFIMAGAVANLLPVFSFIE